MSINIERVSLQTIRKDVYTGAKYGAIAWTIYAIIECLFLVILQWVVKPAYVYNPLHWGSTTLLFIIYPAIGLILGGIFGLSIGFFVRWFRFLQKVESDNLFSLISVFSVVLVFIINFAVQNALAEAEASIYQFLFILFIAVFLAITLIVSVVSNTWFNRFRFLTNSWTAIILLIGVPWTTFEFLYSYSRNIKAVGSITYIAIILTISFLVLKRIEAHRTVRSKAVTTSLVGSFVFLSPFVFIVLGISFFLKQEPLIHASNSEHSPLSSNHPNVILITMDTVRADHLPLYGYERDTTPNLRKLAKNATLFTHAIAPGDMTLPTHASIFTGLYPVSHGAHQTETNQSGKPLSYKFHTLAETLFEKGYLTMGVVANSGYLSPHFGFNQGFQYYDSRLPVTFFRWSPAYFIRGGLGDILSSFISLPVFNRFYRAAEDINKEVFTLLDKEGKDRNPFFLFINYMDAHWPYIPPPPFDTLYPGKDRSFKIILYAKLVKEAMELKRKITDKEFSHLISQYDGGIAYIDFYIEQLIKRLKELGLYENTLIIITSDHGEAFGERSLVGHGVSVYQDQIYVPLIIKYPNINEGRIIKEAVNLVDLMPTVLEVLGYEIPKNIQGQSLLRIGTKNSRILISESYPDGIKLSWHPRFNRIERAIFSWPYKFINSTEGKHELYNLSKDPNEKVNLYSSDDAVSKELETKLNQWLNIFNTAVAESSDSPAELDKDALDRLKALGYIR